MKLSLLKGATSQVVNLFIQDSTSSTGAGKTGLVYNSSGLIAYYMRPGVAATAITLATQTVTGSFSSGGFVEIDATHTPGWYRFDVPNVILASGVNNAGVCFSGATGTAELNLEFQLNDLSAIIQNAAIPNFEFLMVSSTDHVTPKTGLGTGVTATRSIDGAAFASCTNGVSELSGGIYVISLSASDMNGKVITFLFSGSGADNQYVEFITQLY